MRHLLTLVSLLFVGSVWAEDFNFNSPRAKAAMEKYQYDKEDLLRDLEAALKYERTEGSLDEAIKIRDAIATLKQQPDAPVSNAQIPADAVEWNGHFYKAIPLRGTHQTALNYCSENGGHLVRIESKDEQEFIEKIIANSNESHWIDGSDAAREGRWMFSNGTPMQYFNWAPEEPSNWSGDTGGPQHLLTIYPESFTWDDKEPSRHLFPYICEWDGPAGSKQRAKKIPADAVKYKGNYYLAVPINRTHGGAMDYCKLLGGHLVRINNASEHAFVTRLAHGSGMPKCWIDGSDASKENEWSFSDGNRMPFFQWAPDQPGGGEIENNLVMFASDGYGWHDDSEGNTDRGFICEWEEDGPAASDGVFLDDLEEIEFSTHYGAPGKHGEANKKAFLLYNGVKPSHSLFIHPPDRGNAFVRYDLNGDYERLKTKVGLAILGKPDGYRESPKESASPVLFKVYGDDKLLWESKPIQAFGPWLDCDVSIEGVNNLRLTTEALGSHGAAHATWIMPELKPAIKKGNKQSKTRPEEPIKKLSPKHAKRVLDDANLWEGKPGVWYLKRANNFSGRTYERLSQSNRIRSALASVNGRLPTPDEMKSPPVRR